MTSHKHRVNGYSRKEGSTAHILTYDDTTPHFVSSMCAKQTHSGYLFIKWYVRGALAYSVVPNKLYNIKKTLLLYPLALSCRLRNDDASLYCTCLNIYICRYPLEYPTDVYTFPCNDRLHQRWRWRVCIICRGRMRTNNMRASAQ